VLSALVYLALPAGAILYVIVAALLRFGQQELLAHLDPVLRAAGATAPSPVGGAGPPQGGDGAQPAGLIENQ